MPRPTREEVIGRLAYEPGTGEFTWLVCGMYQRPAGSRAGSFNRHGRLYIQIGPRKYTATHLAWLIMTGAWPTKLIDHRDRNPRNNAWVNLREVTESGNSQNRSMGKNNTSGIKGVYWHKATGKWQASIRAGTQRSLGLYDTKEEAAEAYAAAAQLLHGDCASPLRALETTGEHRE